MRDKKHMFLKIVVSLSVLMLFFSSVVCVYASETVVYSEGFENSNGGYTTAGTLDQWQWGTPTNPNGPGSAHSGTKCWVTNLTGDVPKNSTSYLTSPPIILPSTTSGQVLRVRFYAWIAIDEVWDKGGFQVSSNGASFITLVELYHRMQGDWSAYDFDITNYAGGSIYLRFRLYTNDADDFKQSTKNMAGLYIDDVKITLYDSPADKTTLTLQAYEEQDNPPSYNASCPWVFSWNGSGFVQDNDIYSTARGIDQEYTDYYKLNTPLVPVDDKYLLELREITEETSYTDLVKLVAVYHSAATRVAPDENGGIWTYSDPVASASAIDGKGSDVSIQLANEDNLVYKGYNGDTVTLNFSNVDTRNGATLVLQAAGFKDDGDPGTPTGVSPRIFIQTQDASRNWISRHYFYPRNNLSIEAFDLTPYLVGNKLVRLYITSCHTGKYFAIDYVGLDNNAQAHTTTYSLSPISATHSINGDILTKITNSDKEYASMGPGETMSLSFAVPGMMKHARAEVRDFVLITRGYYLLSGTYFVSTWDGTSWVERDGWSILGGGLQYHTFDMSLFLPDPNGQFKVRIWQDFWLYPAGIDYVGLTHAGASATMNSAFDLQKNLDVTSLLNASDNSGDEWLKGAPGSVYPTGRIRNRWVEVNFTTQGLQNTPPTTNPIIVTDLASATPTISWTYADTDNDAQTKYEVEVWTFSGGTGNVMWDPAPGTGTAQSVVYAGLALPLGQTCYARVKAFDGKDWGQWSETAFTSLSSAHALTMYTVGLGTVAPGNGTYNAGSTVELKAYPSPGWSFAGWTGDATGAANTSIVMDSNKVVTGTFTQNVYSLTMYTTGQGSVTPGNSTGYHYNDIVPITAIPASGWSFQGWSGDASGTTNTSITISDNTEVTATFTEAKVDTAVVFSFSPNPVLPSQAVTLSGTLSAVGNVPVYPAQVRVEYSINGGVSWSVFTNLNTNAAGQFSITFNAPGVGSYLVRVSYAGSATYNPSSSTQTLVVQTGPKVDTAVVFSFSPNPASPGQSVTLSGTLKDVSANPVYPAQVKVEYSTNGGVTWSVFTNLNTNTAGQFSVNFGAPRSGTYLVRVSYAGSASYNPSSSTQTLTVS